MTYSPKPELLAGRVILVTGASDGIGREAALAFGRHGATVILSGRPGQKLEAVDDAFSAEDLPEPGLAPLDLASASADDMIELANAIQTQYGKLDGLLHSAGLLGTLQPFETYDMNEWMRVMHVNFTAEVQLTRVMLPVLRKSEDASLVFTTSGVGASPRAYWGAYAVSKAAVDGFARLLADELENTSNIRTNLISPGPTRSKMRAKAFPNEDPMSLKAPAELMPMYLYLMGPDSKGENGKLFTPEWIDGAR